MSTILREIKTESTIVYYRKPSLFSNYLWTNCTLEKHFTGMHHEMICLLFHFHLQLQECIISQFNNHFRIEDNPALFGRD